jgi:hypothetical protein
MKAAALATAAALALVIVAGAGAVQAASPVPGTLGLQLSPAPLHLDDGGRTITFTNLSGGLSLAVALTVSDGYAVEPMTFSLAIDASQVVTITAVDPNQDGTLTATAGGDVAGAVRSAVSLTTRLVHRSPLERIVAQYGALAPLVALVAVLALLASLAALWALRRRRFDSGRFRHG